MEKKRVGILTPSTIDQQIEHEKDRKSSEVSKRRSKSQEQHSTETIKWYAAIFNGYKGYKTVVVDPSDLNLTSRVGMKGSQSVWLYPASQVPCQTPGERRL
jgi:hypothetical protein